MKSLMANCGVGIKMRGVGIKMRGAGKCGEAGAKSCECNKNRESQGGSAAMVGWAGTTGAACLLLAAEF